MLIFLKGVILFLAITNDKTNKKELHQKVKLPENIRNMIIYIAASALWPALSSFSIRLQANYLF